MRKSVFIASIPQLSFLTTREVLNRMIFFGEGSLRNAIRQYLIHYHQERNHQGLENHLIDGRDQPPDSSAPIETIEKLGGMLKHYRRAA